MLRTNKQNLVQQSVLGTIAPCKINLKNPYLVDSTGSAHVVPGTGGITYNVAVGDSALDFEGDHIEPCVSISTPSRDTANLGTGGLSILSCIGNEARVASGMMTGTKGTVTGKHGGVEHVLIDFPPSSLEKMVIGDKIQIKAYGLGMKLKDFPDVHVMNIDPALLRKMGITEKNKQLIIPVTHVIPASIMGSGLGARHSYSGDYDIQLADWDTVRKHGLQDLRIGNVIAISDADCRFGRSIRSGSMSIGIVVHASCITSGHGPGVTIVFSTNKKSIVPRIEEKANIAEYLEIGRRRRRKIGPQNRRR
ncbi:MAG: DUF4438 domain-containing protein [Candidatus Krumholzibacteriota bacterium]|nr:DUF4438 domain-containing protein [Candidatus Krumholzibacteriota bacterium]